MTEKKPQVNQITEGVIWKQLLLFFFPILLGTFFQQMYNTVDTIIVGRFVGTHALAAVGSTGAIINLFIGFFTGIGSGATVIISQRFGAQDDEGVSRSVHTGIALSLASGLFMTVVGIATTPLMLTMLGTPEDIYSDARLYTTIYFTGVLALVLYNIGSGILRALGDAKRPMIYLIVCCVANTVLDILCVVVFRLGVGGAALATTLSQVLSAVLVMTRLLRMSGPSKLFIRKIRFHMHELKGILRIGVPAGLQSALGCISNLIIQSSINSFGSVIVAAWTVHGRIDSIVWMISGAFSVAITTFVGQNFGAQKYDRVRKSVRVCMGMSIGVMAALSVLLVIFARPLFGFFSGDPEVIEEGMVIMWFITPFYWLWMPVEVLSGTMRGVGEALRPMLISSVGMCGLRVVWIFLVVGTWHIVPLLALTYPVTWVVTGVIFAVYYLRGNWLRDRIEALGYAPEIRPGKKVKE